MEVPPLFRWCSLLMASLFAISASFQFDDPDWYLWLPLYATACVVNLVNGFFTYKINQQVVNFALWLGVVLFTKVLLEDMVHGMAGFWSLDMRERVVREKFGSGLVISCMFLQSKASKHSLGRKDEIVASSIQRGMAILVGISYGLSYAYFLFLKKDRDCEQSFEKKPLSL
ncbi:hypothetical protein RJ639_005618 [Escallonia herrerae]|uniref:Transmembrane protein 220 n=1 Tax=Escallonia herrerae TaxID=1293975 RepID=A0AA89AXT7_9ASTE|nr:hypothetical protein RJ639_005618 [Escallonia herrerae]